MHRHFSADKADSDKGSARAGSDVEAVARGAFPPRGASRPSEIRLRANRISTHFSLAMAHPSDLNYNLDI